jgi:BlaI family penicillinase repressor
MSDLNKNELEVLRILWDCGELKPAEIMAQFGWNIENPTLRSVLVGLLDKDLVTRRKQGKAFFYQAKARRRSQFQRAMRRMADVFAGGSTAELILQLVKQEKLTADEIAELRVQAGESVADLDQDNP